MAARRIRNFCERKQTRRVSRRRGLGDKASTAGDFPALVPRYPPKLLTLPSRPHSPPPPLSRRHPYCPDIFIPVGYFRGKLTAPVVYPTSTGSRRFGAQSRMRAVAGPTTRGAQPACPVSLASLSAGNARAIDAHSTDLDFSTYVRASRARSRTNERGRARERESVACGRAHLSAAGHCKNCFHVKKGLLFKIHVGIHTSVGSRRKILPAVTSTDVHKYTIT